MFRSRCSRRTPWFHNPFIQQSRCGGRSAAADAVARERVADDRKKLIVNTLIETAGNRVKAAERLGWGRITLWRKLKFHGLTPVQPGIAGSKRIA